MLAIIKGASRAALLSSRMASTWTQTTQKFAIPHLPELYDPCFLDTLLPRDDTLEKDVIMAPPTVSNPMMDALKASAHHTLTANGAPAFNSTLSSTVDAFNGLNAYSDASTLDRLLTASWKEDPSLTLRLIWQLRSIHEGKAEKEGFYRAFGWLYKNHPRTSIANLHMLVDPVIENKKKPELPRAHGYWKDLCNILALATTDELDTTNATFLHHTRPKYTYPNRSVKKNPTPEAHARHTAEAQARAKADRARVAVERHEIVLRRLQDPKYRALYVAVVRLFVDQLVKDLKVLHQLRQLSPGEDRIPLLKKLSLAGKWAPTPGGSHDRVTNISSAISLLLHHSRSSIDQNFPNAVSNFNSAQAEVAEGYGILRSYYGRWILCPLRTLLLLPEPLMSGNRWTEIRYNRVASLCMKNNMDLFFKHDPEGFQKYLIDVESGKKSISGATLLPHQIVMEIIKLDADVSHQAQTSKYPALQEMKKQRAETQMRVLEAQWKSLVDRLKESGALENSIAICDVSGSMGYLSSGSARDPSPIAPAVSLSLILAQLAKPPFNQGFVTFSANPQFVTLDPNMSLLQTLKTMTEADWGMNTDFNAVFLKLLLPLAIKNKVPKEDMIKQLFVFSDMQFDVSRTDPSTDWRTNHEEIVEAYTRAGYDVPRIVYWDLAGYGTTEVTADWEGVALMNGFSPSMLKVFMGEEDETEEDWEKVGEKTKREVDAERFNPENVMKQSVMKPSFDGLVVLD